MDRYYLGFDLSTQQLKALVVTPDLKHTHSAIVDFDASFSAKYGVRKGVLSHPSRGEVFAPPAMWMEALELVLARLRDAGCDLSRVAGISGAGMQHGTVFWSREAEALLAHLDPARSLVEQLSTWPDRGAALAHPHSPNWQDASTQAECDAFEAAAGGAAELARITGSKAHHRFSGPQILRFRKRFPDDWTATARVSLVSSFLASLLLGAIAPIDVADAGGTNLWDMNACTWHEPLLALAAGSPAAAASLRGMLGPVATDAAHRLGSISPYFRTRFGFAPTCAVYPFTGDNPATLLALPLREGDAIVSLGTSTTLLMSTSAYVPHPAHHLLPHPTDQRLRMFMLCYKNGALARERVRDAINASSPSAAGVAGAADHGGGTPWDLFDATVRATPPLGQTGADAAAPMRLGLFFPLREIVPDVGPGTWRALYDAGTRILQAATVAQASPSARDETSSHGHSDGGGGTWTTPQDDARAILESQLLSLRLRSAALLAAETPPGPAASRARSQQQQPRRIYLVGGGSVNATLARVAGEVLGGEEGVFRLDVGGNACALGAAYKAVWAGERRRAGESERARVGEREGERERQGKERQEEEEKKGGEENEEEGEEEGEEEEEEEAEAAEEEEEEGFEAFVAKRWDEDRFVRRVDEGYRQGLWERYGSALHGLDELERRASAGEMTGAAC